MSDPIVATVVSIPSRITGLEAVVGVMLPQVNRLNVYLNDYDEVPSFLKKPKVVVAQSQLTGNRVDGSKFWWIDKISGPYYHFTIDDDINYPKDYVRTLRKVIKHYRRRAIVGVLGMLYPGDIDNPYDSGRRMFSFPSTLKGNTVVNMIGTGTMAYHTSAIQLDLAEFPEERMPDVAVAVAAQRQQVPMVVVKRKRRWLTSRRMEAERFPLYRLMRKDTRLREIRATTMQACNPWKTFEP